MFRTLRMVARPTDVDISEFMWGQIFHFRNVIFPHKRSVFRQPSKHHIMPKSIQVTRLTHRPGRKC